MRGRLFEVKLDLGPGLEVVSVGPTAVVEAWNPTSPSSSAGRPAALESRGLMIRLAPPVRDQNRVALQLQGYQRLPREGPVKLGLFAPDETTAVGASFVVAGDRSLSVDLDDDPTGAGEAAFRVQEPATDRSASPANGEPITPALAVDGLGSPRTLPVRIAHHARTLRQETVVSAEVSRGSIDLLQKTTFTVRHGTLGVLEIRVPRAIADDWQLLDREVVDREELGRDADGSRHHRLIFDRPVLDRTTLAFRCRLPISPLLDAAGPRELAVPWISFPDAVAGPVRVELTPTPGVVLHAGDPAWTRAAADGRADPGGEFAGPSYTEGSAGSGRPFTFRAQALEPVHLPALLVPRVLIRSSQGFDDAIRYRAWYWVEAHGPVFPFELPDHAKLLAVRVGGRLADRVDFEPARAGYRLRLPADPASRPALVELEYQRPARPRARRGRPLGSRTTRSCSRRSGRPGCRGTGRCSASRAGGPTTTNGPGRALSSSAAPPEAARP